LPATVFGGKRSPFPIVHAQGDTVGISEIEFAQIAVQVLLGAMLIDAFHAAFKDRIVAFNGVGGDVTANVLFNGVSDGLMARLLAANFFVDFLISHEAAFAADVFANNRRNVGNRRAVDMEASRAR
jgi:hypothetical protein